MTAVSLSTLFSEVSAITTVKSAAADTAIQRAIALASSMTTPTLSVNLPSITIGVAPGVQDPTQPYNAVLNSLISAFTANFASAFGSFYAAHFPTVDATFSNALTWLNNALSVGGTGVNVAVEQALFDRDRTRILREVNRNQQQLATSWAARRWPVPPGALTYQQMQLARDGFDKIADSSRQQMITTWTTEIENLRLAVDKMVGLEEMAQRVTLEYVKFAVQTPIEMADQRAHALAELEVQYGGVLAQLYSASVAGQEVALKLGVEGADVQIKAAALQLDASKAKVEMQVQAAIAAAQAFATQAAAALNAIHGQVGWNETDTRDLTGSIIVG